MTTAARTGIYSRCFTFKLIGVALLMITAHRADAQQKIIQLYNGAAPGSDRWTWQEKETDRNPLSPVASASVHGSSTLATRPESRGTVHASWAGLLSGDQNG
jgi:hypothetical protein